MLKLDCIEIKDDDEGFSPKHIVVSRQYRDYIKKVLVPHGLICDRIDALAKQIFEEYTNTSPNESLYCLCVLKGGFRFFSDLTERLTNLNRVNNINCLKLNLDFIRLKSYVNTESCGDVQITGLNDPSVISNQNVLLIEDLVDSGKSMVAAIKHLKEYSPKNIKCCSLLYKRTKKSNGYIPDYIGFSVPDDFIVGYAIDYNDQFRDLEHVCAINEAGIEKFKKIKTQT